MIVQKYLAEQGICSRHEAEALLRAGLIFVNGKPAVPGVPLLPTDTVTIDPLAQKKLDNKVTVAVYKPRGVTCSRSHEEGANVFDVFPQWQDLAIVGRLDKESEGLLLLSSNGLVTKRVTGQAHEVAKEYEITTQEKVFAGKLKPLATGIMLDGRPTLPAKIAIIDKHTFRITLREGRNRQIRRMCGQVQLTVTSLKRIRIGSLVLGSMKPGNFRLLRETDIQSLLHVNSPLS